MVEARMLPEEWDVIRLGDLADMKSGFACAKKNLVEQGQGIPHLRPFNIATNGEMDLSEVYYIPEDFKHNIADYFLKPGHVLFNNTNSVELVGKTAIVRDWLPCGFSNHITRLEVDESRVRAKWLALALLQL